MIRLSDSALVSRVDDEAVLLDADNSIYYGLNSVGSRMLELMTENDDCETAIRLAVEEFDTSPDRVRSDFLALLETLLTHELVKVNAS
jgi:hypothetical protein